MKSRKKNSKKNLNEKVAKEKNKKLFFFDESRFGTHSKIGHGWFPTGSRKSVMVNLGFKSFYVYGAVCSFNGKSFSMILPEVNTVNMNIFLEKFSAELGNQEIILVMDGASWHKAKDLMVPKNIEIFYLPPYSPDLNPIERLWAYIKKHTLRNKLYVKLEDLEVDVCDFIKNLDPLTTRNTCTANYLYI